MNPLEKILDTLDKIEECRDIKIIEHCQMIKVYLRKTIIGCALSASKGGMIELVPTARGVSNAPIGNGSVILYDCTIDNKAYVNIDILTQEFRVSKHSGVKLTLELENIYGRLLHVNPILLRSEND